jgi:hypothetical protein
MDRHRHRRRALAPSTWHRRFDAVALDIIKTLTAEPNRRHLEGGQRIAVRRLRQIPSTDGLVHIRARSQQVGAWRTSSKRGQVQVRSSPSIARAKCASRAATPPFPRGRGSALASASCRPARPARPSGGPDGTGLAGAEGAAATATEARAATGAEPINLGHFRERLART